MEQQTSTRLRTIRRHRCFDGIQGIYCHTAAAISGDREFAVYIPPQAVEGPVPMLTWLPGLDPGWEGFVGKAGAQRSAAEHGLLLVVPDTRPCPAGAAAGQPGAGAGLCVDATVEPWAPQHRMYSYVTAELPALVARHFPADPARQGIFGHGPGGCGALVCALRNPQQYRSVSAFAPMAAPSRCPWGEQALAAWLGPDRAAWAAYDPCALAAGAAGRSPILVDQGTADEFLYEQLKPHLLEEACARAGLPLRLRLRENYDHGWFFVATFMAEHLAHHAALLRRPD